MSRARTTILLSLLAAGFVITILLTFVGRGSGTTPASAGGTYAVGVQVLLAVAITIAVAIVVITLTSRPITPETRPRRLTWRLLAEKLGGTYVKSPADQFITAFHGLPGVPRTANAKHVLRGTLEAPGHPPRPFIAFQSTYLLNTGQAALPVSNSVYVVEAPDWPIVEISPRSTVSKVIRRFRPGRELVLENSYFNRTFKVFSPDEDFGLVLLSPQMQFFLVGKPDVRWRIGGGRVALIYKGGLKLNRVEESLERMRNFWAQVPPELDAWESKYDQLI